MTSRQASLLQSHGGKTSWKQTQQHGHPSSLRPTVTIAAEWANSRYTTNTVFEPHQDFTLSICDCAIVFVSLLARVGRLSGQSREFRRGLR